MLEATLPILDAFIPTPTLIMVRFHRWDDILKLPAPDQKLAATTALWHFGRAMAYASTGKPDSAEKERSLLVSAVKNLPKDQPYGFNTARDVFNVAGNVLSARIALAKNDKQVAIEFLKKAVDVEDLLNYDEPEDWYIPVRESLGGMLIISGSYAEAESVFRAELKKHPRNGRALFGLMESLKKQNKTAAAQFVQREFDAAWKNADTRLRVEDL
jgi:tetratricopeptide (TPR) repeat protein